ncbi:MAG: hypothetical protein KDB01_09955, partial [Planctomycetaceae bacterium]|nr:hypothetical protein [Planctomycetaceae bacterium]
NRSVESVGECVYCFCVCGRTTRSHLNVLERVEPVLLNCPGYANALPHGRASHSSPVIPAQIPVLTELP